MGKVREAICADRFGDFIEEYRTRKEYTDNVKPTDFENEV